MTSGYRALFRRPGTAQLAAAALLGRLPNGMLGLAFVLVLLEETGSCAAGGAAAGLHTLTAAVSGPLWSRAADRAGPRAVLLVTGTGQALVLTAVAVLAARTENRLALVALAAASGVLPPPLGAIMRALWSRTLADDPGAKAAAFAYESVVVDVAFVLGPSLVAGLAALGGPSLALLCAAVATATGCLATAASSRVGAAARPNGVGRNEPGPLRRPAVLGVLPIGFLLLGSVSAAEVSLVAYADGADRRDAAGPLIAALAAGGVLGGLCQGGRRKTGAPARRLTVLLAALAAGWAALAACRGLWQLGGLLVPAGLLLNAAVTAQFRTLDEVAPREALTEAFGWLNSLGAAGSSAGAAAAGAVAGPGPDPGAGFLLAAGCCAAGCAVAVACRGTWQRVVPLPVPVPAQKRPGPPGGVPSRRPR
ncbi:MFS transporter [Streptomyces sp. AV19]|uniref:MFS transporter n=1 Tax=Streptomyces sp. AV19 TaxID=2793068 RepID=UPI0024132F89|nr:MFS transporter [Streptomyces sp. AV19]MDG4536503.1 MFS transporter [Streptomyces sp. AV19]